jgi:nucleotide-binding universal stress UspA family protein
MEHFKRILVGVDLDRCPTPDASSQEPMTRLNFDSAVRLARAFEAELLIFTAFHRGQDVFEHADAEGGTPWKDQANRELESLVGMAHVQGVQAKARVVLGEPSAEIIREVGDGQHDLVVVGTHEMSGLRRYFIGNTATRLLRNCPCPVWVSKVAIGSRPRILLATDLHAASNEALFHGTALAACLGGEFHVLHVVNFANDPLGNGELGQPDPLTICHHEEMLRSAEQIIIKQLGLAGADELRQKCQVHVVGDVGDPAYRIEQFITKENVDVLLLGTAARQGIAGLIVGNTAESLLPRAACSLLVVKKSTFESTVA